MIDWPFPPLFADVHRHPRRAARAVAGHIAPIMRVSGALTFTMVYAAAAPDAAHLATFGEPLSGDAARLVVRSWGVLIALVGAMLFFSAGRPALRPMALAVAATSKAAFVGLVLAEGSRFLGHQAGFAIALDAILAAVFASYLAQVRRERR